jgi:iron-sulfur cluster assembly protein
MSAGISITENAIVKVKQLMTEAKMGQDYFVRVSVKGGGCSGLSYDLDFDNEKKESDQEFPFEDIRIICDLKSYLYLAGTELDFSDGLNGKGFQFINPNASRTCGCGESFAV